MISSNSQYQNQGYNLVIYNCLQNQRDESCTVWKCCIKKLGESLIATKMQKSSDCFCNKYCTTQCYGVKAAKESLLWEALLCLFHFNLRNQEKYWDSSLFATTDLETFVIKRMVQEQ